MMRKLVRSVFCLVVLVTVLAATSVCAEAKGRGKGNSRQTVLNSGTLTLGDRTLATKSRGTSKLRVNENGTVSAAVSDTYTQRKLVPNCGINLDEPGGSDDALCGAATRTCTSPGDIRYAVSYRTAYRNGVGEPAWM